MAKVLFAEKGKSFFALHVLPGPQRKSKTV
jgi:hypothetical protein